WRPLRRDARCRLEGFPRPGDELVGFVQEPLRRAPKGEVDNGALLFVIKRRISLGLLERRAVELIDAKVERVFRHDPQHQPVAEEAALAEHAPQRDAAEWR